MCVRAQARHRDGGEWESERESDRDDETTTSTRYCFSNCVNENIHALPWALTRAAAAAAVVYDVYVRAIRRVDGYSHFFFFSWIHFIIIFIESDRMFDFYTRESYHTPPIVFFFFLSSSSSFYF